MKKKTSYLLIIFLSFMFISNVHANTNFKTCSTSEPSYFRKTPGGSVVTDVDKHSVLLSTDTRVEVVEETNGYKKVKGNYYSNNYVGWISNSYLKDCKTYTTDDNYGNSLRSEGFPESYILPLQKLHAIHPNWIFKSSKNGNGLDFNSVINGEYNPVNKNLIDSPYDTLRAKDGAAYNNGVYTQFEPGWYGASKQTISFYIDPRNWLNEYTIYMFEQQSYNSTTHTEAAVNSITSGTYLNDYAKYFVEAGKKYNVSPVALAVRAIQEQGVSGSTISKMNYNGTIYYNFFNINAQGSTKDQIYNNALQTAIKNNWTSPEACINAGASLFAGNYIKHGQDTNYYQKFNTIYNGDNNSTLYFNQYMANVRVLPSESYKTRSSYKKANKIESNITFKIPVYNNMPDSTTLGINGNGDNTLKSLTVSNCSFNFYSSVVNYSCSVPSNVNKVTVKAEKAGSSSSVTGVGDYNLIGNTTIIKVVVTAENGDTKTYTVTINKSNTTNGSQNSGNNNQNNGGNNFESPASIISGIGLDNRNNFIYGIALGNSRASFISNIKNRYSTSNISIVNKYNSGVNNGSISTGDKVTITNGSNSQVFTVVINGDPSGDGSVDISDLAMVKAKMLNKVNLSVAEFDAADVNNDGKVDISDLAMVKAHMLGKIKITK